MYSKLVMINYLTSQLAIDFFLYLIIHHQYSHISQAIFQKETEQRDFSDPPPSTLEILQKCCLAPLGNSIPSKDKKPRPMEIPNKFSLNTRETVKIPFLFSIWLLEIPHALSSVPLEILPCPSLVSR